MYPLKISYKKLDSQIATRIGKPANQPGTWEVTAQEDDTLLNFAYFYEARLVKGFPVAFTFLNQLKVVSFYGSDLVDISAFAYLEGRPVEELDLGFNDVEDGWPLKGLLKGSTLRHLYLEGNKLKDVSWLLETTCPLEDLDLGENKGLEVGGLKGFFTRVKDSLENFHAHSCGLVTLEGWTSGIELCLKLKWLCLYENKIQDLEPLRGLFERTKNLEILSFGNNLIESLDPLSSFNPEGWARLERLSFSGNQIKTLAPLVREGEKPWKQRSPQNPDWRDLLIDENLIQKGEDWSTLFNELLNMYDLTLEGGWRVEAAKTSSNIWEKIALNLLEKLWEKRNQVLLVRDGGLLGKVSQGVGLIDDLQGVVKEWILGEQFNKKMFEKKDYFLAVGVMFEMEKEAKRQAEVMQAEMTRDIQAMEARAAEIEAQFRARAREEQEVRDRIHQESSEALDRAERQAADGWFVPRRWNDPDDDDSR